MYTSQQCLPAETDHNLTAAVYFPPIWRARHLSQSSSQKNTALVTFLNTSAIIYHVLRNLQFIAVVETTRRVTLHSQLSHCVNYPPPASELVKVLVTVLTAEQVLLGKPSKQMNVKNNQSN